MSHRRENREKGSAGGRVKKSRRGGDCSSEVAEEKEKEPAVVVSPPCFLDERALNCDICLDLLHNAMSVSPCNHKFCAGCIYEWHDNNRTCPKCRWHVSDISRDPFVNSIVEQYLQAYPEKARSESCRITLDERELLHLERYQARRQIWDEESESSHLATQDGEESLNDSFETDEEEEEAEYDEEDEDGDEDEDEEEEEEEEEEAEEGMQPEYESTNRDEVYQVLASVLSHQNSDDEAVLSEARARRLIEDQRIARLREEKSERARERQREAEAAAEQRTAVSRKRARNGRRAASEAAAAALAVPEQPPTRRSRRQMANSN